ncbi:hypothetical protein CEXT_111231 [Caerostris extrusa]|uniref:Uncharacterized protein n=1 Tax=Caerostris extrusa TaxID=172846 RepID=A0AAV4MXG4_CAEEX|nr:hypothetical protein CEXT_111231 [Caerostris extrusa]
MRTVPFRTRNSRDEHYVLHSKMSSTRCTGLRATYPHQHLCCPSPPLETWSRRTTVSSVLSLSLHFFSPSGGFREDLAVHLKD